MRKLNLPRFASQVGELESDFGGKVSALAGVVTIQGWRGGGRVVKASIYLALLHMV